MVNKNIIFVVNRLYGGGAERVICTLANSFSGQGYNITICSFSEFSQKYEISSNIALHHVSAKSRLSFLKKIKRIYRLRNFIKKQHGVIISFEYFVNMQTILATLFIKNRIIVSERNDPSMEGNNLKLLRNMLYRFADVLVCQTKRAKHYFPRSIQDKTIVIPNPIKAELPEPFHGKRSSEIVTFCRIEKQKNLPLLVNAFEMLTRNYSYASLLIYGEGSDKNALEQLIIHKGLQNKVRLFSFADDIHRRVISSGMFVCSSDYEGMSNSMLEAMAIGLPVISTDCAGAGDVIKSGVNGLLVPVGNAPALYRAMKYLFDYPDVAQSLSENAVKIKESLSAEKISVLWQNIIQEDELC